MHNPPRVTQVTHYSHFNNQRDAGALCNSTQSWTRMTSDSSTGRVGSQNFQTWLGTSGRFHVKFPITMQLDLEPHLIRSSLSPPKSTTQTASTSVQPFFLGPYDRADRPTGQQTDRSTDREHATGSVTVGRVYVRSRAMRPRNNNNKLSK